MDKLAIYGFLMILAIVIIMLVGWAGQSIWNNVICAKFGAIQFTYWQFMGMWFLSAFPFIGLQGRSK